MTFTTVGECPSTEKWQQRAKNCTRSDHYHCLLNENSVVVEGCINPIWVESGNCPVYNSKAFKLDAQKCRTQVCPNGVYRSNNVFQYNGCFTPKREVQNLNFRTSEAPISLNVDESMQQNKTTPYVPSRPGTSSSVAAVVIPIILIIVLLGVIASAIVWYKRKRGRDQHAFGCKNGSRNNRLRICEILICFCNEKKNQQQQKETEERFEHDETLLSDQHAFDNDKGSRNTRLRTWRILSCFCNEKKALQQQTEKKESLEENEKPLSAIEESPHQQSTGGAIGCPSTKDKAQNDNPGSFTREELLIHMNFNIKVIAQESSEVSEMAILLQGRKTLALIGDWGSGKRTLAVQIALELEKMLNEKFQFKVIPHFDETCEPIISGLSQPTVIILPDLYKFWYTDQHVEDVKNSLNRIQLFTKDKKLFIIASSTGKAWTSFTRFFPYGNAGSLFPIRIYINTSSKTLSEIGIINQFVLKEEEMKDILGTKSLIGKPLITILYCKNPAYRNAQFLNDPLLFILFYLRCMRDSTDVNERMKFRLLEYTMFQGGKIEKEKLDNDTVYPLFEEMNFVKDKREYIQGCVTQLLNGYMETTFTGNSYRMLHDVITKCVFIVAAEKEPELTFKKCDALLLLKCIRMKSMKEKIISERSKYSIDYNALSMGIPTESFPMVARIFKERNEIRAMLRKVKLYNDKYFQRVWNNI